MDPTHIILALLVAALAIGLWYQERDRRLHAEGARTHTRPAKMITPDDPERRAAELIRVAEEHQKAQHASEIDAAYRKIRGEASARGFTDEQIRAEARRIVNRAGGQSE